MRHQESFYPAVRVNKIDQKYRATVGLELTSLLSAHISDISFRDSKHPESKMKFNPAFSFYNSYISLLKSLAAWPKDISAELHISSFPDLAHIVRGRIDITLVLHAHAGTEEDAKEEVLSRYTILHGILNAYIPEA